MGLLIKGARALQLYPEAISKVMDIYIQDGKITRVGKNLESELGSGKVQKVIEAQDRYVMPGNVCAHNHFYSTLARGITANIKPSYDFVAVLQNLWWRLDRALDSSSLHYSGLVGAIEAVKAGSTTVIDHQASPSFIRGSLKVLKETFETCGLRGILCYEVTDRNGFEDRDRGIEENVEFIEYEETELLKGALGAHAPFTLSDESLNSLSEAVRAMKRGLHIHLSEDRYDLSHSHHCYGLHPAERLARHRLLDAMSLVIHGVHLLEGEVEILNRHGSFLVHNPRSNMNNRVGYCALLPSLDNVAIGTDGIGSDMFEETKLGYFKSREAGIGFNPSDYTRFLCNGNMILERYFGDKFGRIEPGFAADLVILDYRNPTPMVADNIGSHFIFGMGAHAVETVLINGRCVYECRQFPFDVERIYAEARKEADRMWEKMEGL
jgi:putative selenium metabolism protein SsnA